MAEYELKWMRGLVKERQDAWNTTPAWLVLEWIDFALATIGPLPTERSKDTI